MAAPGSDQQVRLRDRHNSQLDTELRDVLAKGCLNCLLRWSCCQEQSTGLTVFNFFILGEVESSGIFPLACVDSNSFGARKNLIATLALNQNFHARNDLPVDVTFYPG